MSTNKTKTLVQTARKMARKNIELSLITDLKAVAGKLAPLSRGVEKEINKDAKKLAKKISKKLVIDGAVQATVEQKAVSAPVGKSAVAKAAKNTAKAEKSDVK